MTMRTKLFCITLASMLLLSLIGHPVQAVNASSIAAAKSTGAVLLSSRFEQVDLSNALSYPTDPTADIPWSAGTSGVADIQAAFNHARTVENSQLGISIPMMTLPSQTAWNSMSDGQKALWLINRERIDRGVAPLQGLESNVGGVAQYYADYLLDNNTWGHTADGRDPWQRLEDNPAIGACHDFLSVSENLAVFVTSGSSIPLPIEQAIYMWMYDDGNCCGWGHRHAILWYPYNDNSSPAGSEGFLGIGRSNGGPYQGPFSQSWPFAEIIVMNVFDPCMDWVSSSPPENLLVSKTGNGGGTVTSNPAGINCGSDCSENYATNTTVILTATPAAGSIFTGWGGACSGTGTCTVNMTAAKSVTAHFIKPVTSSTYDDTNAAWGYSSGWAVYNAGGPYAGTLHYTNTTDATATIAFSGTRFKLSFTRHTNRGSFEVWVDGSLVTTINAAGPALAWQQTYVSPTFANGAHIVILKNVSAPDKYVDLDAIQTYGTPVAVPAGVYDDTNSNWLYSGGWAVYNAGGPYNNTIHYTGNVGDYAELFISGGRFKVSFTKHTNRGSIDVYVDGVKIDTINANAGALMWQQTYLSPALGAGNHTVRLVYASGGTYIDIDALQVYAAATAGIYDDTNSNWLYTGAWAVYSAGGPYNNTIHYTGTIGNAAEFLFNGTRFSVTYTKHTNRGLIDVYVDGVKIDTIDANNASLAWQQVYTSPVQTSGNHLVRLVYASGGSYIDIDAIQVYGTPVAGGTYDDANPAWQYAGSWAVFNGSGPSANTIHYTGTVGNSASLLFTGNRFTLTFTKHPNRGLIDVYVDGVKIDTINASNLTLAWQQTYTSPVLSSGNHLVRFVYASGGTYIDVDAITILP